MPIEVENKITAIDINIINKQSVVVIEDDIVDNRLLNNYRMNLRKKEKVIYINFKYIHIPHDLANALLEQYRAIIDNDVQLELSQESYDAVADVLHLFSLQNNIGKNIVVWLDNFTDILSLKENDWLFGLLRGEFQHHQNIVYVFTSNSKSRVNEIFMNHDNPFFKFARIVS